MADAISYVITNTNKSRVYIPRDGVTQVIDVVREYPWTLSPESSREDIPYIRLKEYQQTTGQIIGSIVYYSRVANSLNNDLISVLDKDNALDIYRYKFLAQPTGFEYIFPYFNPKKINRSNSFGSDTNPFEGLINFGKQLKSFQPQTRGIGSALAGSLGVLAFG